jgi:hypothetical protein
MFSWRFDSAFGWHILDINDNEFAFVWPLPQGNGFGVSAMRHIDITCGREDYRPTLALAKMRAEELARTGDYRAYMLDRTPAPATVN